jgi:hypothetical protein
VKLLARRRVDLNAKHAARSEAENEPHELVLGYNPDGSEQVFLLRPRLPMEFSALLRRGATDEAIRLILVNPDDWERFRREIPDDDDLYDITELYEMVPGESSASTPSSNGDGRSSRPTSNASTTSTLPVPAGERALLESDASAS